MLIRLKGNNRCSVDGPLHQMVIFALTHGSGLDSSGHGGIGCITRNRNDQLTRAATYYKESLVEILLNFKQSIWGLKWLRWIQIENFVIQTYSKYAFDCIARNKEPAWKTL